MKYCCFRFDADTHVCVAQGIPRLSELGHSLGVQFTFFVNMGRAFSRRITAGKMLQRLWRPRRGSMPAAAKLGTRESLVAAVLNPQAGRSCARALRDAAQAGHEIGLHGGRNHAIWERSAHRWSERQLRDEIDIGRRWLAEAGIDRVDSFASPCWNSPAALKKALPAAGFHVLADVYNPKAQEASLLGELILVPTNITAPGASGYLEAAHLRGWSAAETRADFCRQLRGQPRLAVVYDHPFFAGLRALETVRDLVRAALDEGWKVGTIREAAPASLAQPVG